MSTSQQCKRRRKQCRIDPKYRSQKVGDLETSRRRQVAKAAREHMRQQRAKGKR